MHKVRRFINEKDAFCSMSFLRLEKDLAFRMFDLLGVRLSTSEREAVQKLPTDNMIAFMQYYRGLDFEDRGMVKEAQNAFSSAVRVDPKFSRAQTALNRTIALSQVSPDVPQLRPKHALKQPQPKRLPPPKDPPPPIGLQPSLISGPQPGPGLTQQVIPTTSARLFQTAQNVSAGFVPGIEARKPTTEENNPTFGNSVPIYIRIPLPRKP
jgi:hypothetical protein